jgi:hypothetical protein
MTKIIIRAAGTALIAHPASPDRGGTGNWYPMVVKSAFGIIIIHLQHPISKVRLRPNLGVGP